MDGASGVVEVVMMIVVVEGGICVCMWERLADWLTDWLIDSGNRKEGGSTWVLKLQL